MDKREEQFKRMVLAYLHDPPHKVLDLGRHEEFAESFIRTVWIDRPEGSEDLRIEGMTESRDSYPWETTPDHAAAAADRVIFPNRFAKAGGPFDGSAAGARRARRSIRRWRLCRPTRAFRITRSGCTWI